jgi:hypothetical protein
VTCVDGLILCAGKVPTLIPLYPELCRPGRSLLPLLISGGASIIEASLAGDAAFLLSDAGQLYIVEEGRGDPEYFN